MSVAAGASGEPATVRVVQSIPADGAPVVVSAVSELFAEGGGRRGFLLAAEVRGARITTGADLAPIFGAGFLWCARSSDACEWEPLIAVDVDASDPAQVRIRGATAIRAFDLSLVESIWRSSDAWSTLSCEGRSLGYGGPSDAGGWRLEATVLGASGHVGKLSGQLGESRIEGHPCTFVQTEGQLALNLTVH